MGNLYKIGQFTKTNKFQKKRLEENRSRLENMLETQGMKTVRWWIFKKIGIKMNPSQVRRILNYRKHQNRSLDKDIQQMAKEVAGHCGTYAPLGYSPSDNLKARLMAAGLVQAGEKIRIF